MPIRIVFSDIDGTLLNEKRSLSKATIEIFKKLKGKTPIVLISARMPKAMRHLQKVGGIEDQPIIAYNGGLILKNKEILHSTEIPNQLTETITAFDPNIHFSLYHNDDWFIPKKDYWALREINNTKVDATLLSNEEVINQWKSKKIGAHKIMCMGNIDDIDRLFEYLETNYTNHLHLYRSKSTYIEISPKSISKKTAISYLLKHQYPKLTLAEAVAFGDNYNDMEMLNAVGYGVAVENAKQEVKDIAKYHTKAGVKDGVAAFLEKHF